MEDIFSDLGVEVTFKDKDDFLKIRETLTRMGVSSRKENKLFQYVIFYTREVDMPYYISKNCLF